MSGIVAAPAAAHGSAPGFRLFALLAGALLMTSNAAWGGGDLRGIPEVIDGDTLDLGGQRLRLSGIDAPELAQRCWLETRLYDCGRVARSALLDLTAGSEVICRPLAADAPDPTPAHCTAGGYDLAEGMTYTGWALANPSETEPDSADAKAALYRREESRARAAGRGLWRGRFVAPWDWRGGERLAEEAE